MSSIRNVRLALVFSSLGFVTAALGLRQSAAQQVPSPRYEISQEVIVVAGGLAGAVMTTVTDHQENKAFVYLKIGKASEGNRPELKATIDLTSAGQPTLDYTRHSDN